jgi:thiazolinyl imide reductase
LRKYNVIICGTWFGQVYLSAFLSGDPHFRLAGILARGSQRSRRYAREFGVPLYTHVNDILPGIDVACVVIRSAIIGGEGTEIAKSLLKRGIHVIQEHPVHFKNIKACLDLAKKNNVCYHINTHHVHVKPITTFIDYLVKARQKQEIIFIEGTCSFQTIYSLMDIIGRALGGIRPYGVTKALAWETSLLEEYKNNSSLGVIPFKCVQGIIKGIPFTLKIQTYYDPDDLDNNILIMHRLCIGMLNGNLTLVNTHGPVVWSQSFAIPKENQEEISFQKRSTAFIGQDTAAAVLYSEDPAPSLSSTAKTQWPDGVRLALNRLKEHILTNRTPAEQSMEYLTDLSSMWSELMRQFGEPQAISIPQAAPSFPDPLSYRKEIFSTHE